MIESGRNFCRESADLIAGVRKVIFHFIEGIWILVCFNKPVQAIPNNLSAIAAQL
jgi:hypothetical protein